MGSTPAVPAPPFWTNPFSAEIACRFFLIFAAVFKSPAPQRGGGQWSRGTSENPFLCTQSTSLFSFASETRYTSSTIGAFVYRFDFLSFSQKFPRAAACGAGQRRVSQSQNILFLISIFYDATKEVHFLPRMECRGACCARSGANPSVQKRLARIVHHGRQPQRYVAQPSVCRR